MDWTVSLKDSGIPMSNVTCAVRLYIWHCVSLKANWFPSCKTVSAVPSTRKLYSLNLHEDRDRIHFAMVLGGLNGVDFSSGRAYECWGQRCYIAPPPVIRLAIVDNAGTPLREWVGDETCFKAFQPGLSPCIKSCVKTINVISEYETCVSNDLWPVVIDILSSKSHKRFSTPHQYFSCLW